MPDRNSLVTAARAYLGSPFLHAGRNRHGLDCLGLVVLSCRDSGVRIRDCPKRNYGTAASSQLEGYLELQMDRVEGPLLEGDLYTFWADIPGVIQHIGLVTSKGILHATAVVGRVVEQPVDLGKFVRAYRFREFA